MGWPAILLPGVRTEVDHGVAGAADVQREEGRSRTGRGAAVVEHSGVLSSARRRSRLTSGFHDRCAQLGESRSRAQRAPARRALVVGVLLLLGVWEVSLGAVIDYGLAALQELLSSAMGWQPNGVGAQPCPCE
ncbi:hypothetical protein Dimus_011411 [Dionaea muscipula]